MITVGRPELGRLKALLQRGVVMRLDAPRSVLAFLVQDLGLAPSYVERRITTVFLDGQVVDALDAATLRHESRVALSAAMPGLVGATLRRSGAYAAMRAEITRRGEPAPQARVGATEVVHLKVFNLLIDELGPAILDRGILLDREEAGALGLPLNGGGEARGGLVEVRVRLE